MSLKSIQSDLSGKLWWPHQTHSIFGVFVAAVNFSQGMSRDAGNTGIRRKLSHEDTTGGK
jgi:hypothetical protein